MGGVAGDRERIAHVVRRLSMGPHPELLDALDSTDAAVARALDLTAPAAPLPRMQAPTENKPRVLAAVGTIEWWIDRMQRSPRLVEERLVWFWHDHFATSIQKVREPYLMHQQHATIRAHATGSFAELLHAMAKDPAMLVYLDGVSNRAGQVNENFGRECLELFTMGIGGGYTQRDVVETSRACSGWTVNVPGRMTYRADRAPWSAVFVGRRHDRGVKTLLGRTGNFALDGALDVILEHPSTGRHVASKLYRELVGVDPDDRTAERLGAEFARDYAILPLVERIVSEPAFTADDAVRARVRSPIEKLVGILQAAGNPRLDVSSIGRRRFQGVSRALRTLGFVPMVPPNVGGFPDGALLLGPHHLVHAFDLLQAVASPPAVAGAQELLARFGLFDVSAQTRRVVGDASDAGTRFALAAMSPEFAVT